MITATSLCAAMEPAGRFATVTPYCCQTWPSWLGEPVRYSQFGTVVSPSCRSNARVNVDGPVGRVGHDGDQLDVGVLRDPSRTRPA